jgi:hypothetical protein
MIRFVPIEYRVDCEKLDYLVVIQWDHMSDGYRITGEIEHKTVYPSLEEAQQFVVDLVVEELGHRTPTLISVEPITGVVIME